MVFKLFAFEIEIKVNKRQALPKVNSHVEPTDLVKRDYLRAMSYFLRN